MIGKIDNILYKRATEIVNDEFKEIETSVASLDTAAVMIGLKLTKEEIDTIDDCYELICKMQQYEERNQEN